MILFDTGPLVPRSLTSQFREVGWLVFFSCKSPIDIEDSKTDLILKYGTAQKK